MLLLREMLIKLHKYLSNTCHPAVSITNFGTELARKMIEVWLPGILTEFLVTAGRVPRQRLWSLLSPFLLPEECLERALFFKHVTGVGHYCLTNKYKFKDNVSIDCEGPVVKKFMFHKFTVEKHRYNLR